jgi:galactose-1-phosphate uridylyltransferase
MESLVITPKSKEELEKIQRYLKSEGILSKKLSEQEKLDLGLSQMMKEVDKTKMVSKEKINKIFEGL